MSAPRKSSRSKRAPAKLSETAVVRKNVGVKSAETETGTASTSKAAPRSAKPSNTEDSRRACKAPSSAGRKRRAPKSKSPLALPSMAAPPAPKVPKLAHTPQLAHAPHISRSHRDPTEAQRASQEKPNPGADQDSQHPQPLHNLQAPLSGTQASIPTELHVPFVTQTRLLSSRPSSSASRPTPVSSLPLSSSLFLPTTPTDRPFVVPPSSPKTSPTPSHSAFARALQANSSTAPRSEASLLLPAATTSTAVAAESIPALRLLQVNEIGGATLAACAQPPVANDGLPILPPAKKRVRMEDSIAGEQRFVSSGGGDSSDSGVAELAPALLPKTSVTVTRRRSDLSTILSLPPGLTGEASPVGGADAETASALNQTTTLTRSEPVLGSLSVVQAPVAPSDAVAAVNAAEAINAAMSSLPPEISSRAVVTLFGSTEAATAYCNAQLAYAGGLPRTSLAIASPQRNLATPMETNTGVASCVVANKSSSVLDDIWALLQGTNDQRVDMNSSLAKCLSLIECPSSLSGGDASPSGASFMSCPGKTVLFCLLKMRFKDLKLCRGVPNRKSLASTFILHRVMTLRDETSSAILMGDESLDAQRRMDKKFLYSAASFYLSSDSSRSKRTPEFFVRLKAVIVKLSSLPTSHWSADAILDAVDAHLKHILDPNDAESHCDMVYDVLDACHLIVKDWRNARFISTLSMWELKNAAIAKQAQSAHAASPGDSGPQDENSVAGAAFDLHVMKQAAVRCVNIYRANGEPEESPLSSEIIWSVIDGVYKVDPSSLVSLSMVSAVCGAILGTRLKITPATVFGYKQANAYSKSGQNVKLGQRFEVCRRFRACVIADLDDASKGQAPLEGWSEADASAAEVVKVVDGSMSGWSIKVGKSGLRRSVVLDVSPETKTPDLAWLADAKNGMSILAQGRSLLTPVGAFVGRSPGQDTDV